MPSLKVITGADSPILRQPTEKVPKATKDVLKLLKDMATTVEEAEGLGLAAPQIGKSLRICLALINGKMTPLINPEISNKSEETWVHEEGCLSLPGVNIDVERPKTVTLTYIDARGAEQERRLEEWDARIVQHEVDHLDGVLIVDYA
jgi:peptide deformylase